MQQYLPFTVLKQFAKKIEVAKALGLQQYLPFTVLKRFSKPDELKRIKVATVLTVYGIETREHAFFEISYFTSRVATVLTVYGIETKFYDLLNNQQISVATVLTVYGIETWKNFPVPPVDP